MRTNFSAQLGHLSNQYDYPYFHSFDIQEALDNLKLSKSDYDFICLWLIGLSMKECAELLNRSRRTVETRIARIKEKTGISSKCEMHIYIYNANLLYDSYTHALEIISEKTI